MKKLFLPLVLSFSVFAQMTLPELPRREGIDLELLQNNKEPFSRILDKEDIKDLVEAYPLSSVDAINEILKQSINEVMSNPRQCDLGLIDSVVTKLSIAGYPVEEKDLKEYIYSLRAHNLIDDILTSLLVDLNELHYDIQNKSHKVKGYKLSGPLYDANDLSNLYGDLKELPNEKDLCLLGAWYGIINNYKTTNDKRKDKYIRALNYFALEENYIDRNTYNVLETLRESDILERKIFLSGYLNKTFFAKDLLVPFNARRYDISVEDRDDYVMKKIGWFNNTSKREYLYNKYSDEQLIVLTNVLKKASIRMGADPDYESDIPVISQDIFYTDETGETTQFTDNYVLASALDQYEYAVRRMRMEIYNLQMFKAFSNVKVEFEDIVLAALETGYITHEEVGLALKYDDLWNREKSKLAKALGLVMRVGGMAVFYLPPPYNVIGAIGVTLINAKVINKPRGENNDNPTSIFF